MYSVTITLIIQWTILSSATLTCGAQRIARLNWSYKNWCTIFSDVINHVTWSPITWSNRRVRLTAVGGDGGLDRGHSEAWWSVPLPLLLLLLPLSTACCCHCPLPAAATVHRLLLLGRGWPINAPERAIGWQQWTAMDNVSSSWLAMVGQREKLIASACHLARPHAGPVTPSCAHA